MNHGLHMIIYPGRIFKIMKMVHAVKNVDVENAKNNKDESFYDNVNQEDIDDHIDDDGKVEIDIAETEKLEKMLDTHYKVMGMTFQSQGDAYMFYNNHAKERGFGIRKEKRNIPLEEIIGHRRYKRMMTNAPEKNAATIGDPANIRSNLCRLPGHNKARCTCSKRYEL
ncbi:hypothetical protein D1007_39774 [Hordeum vulgare]|nr:hypothetical protein D1007_39774 [Hordeum vulgare]